MNSYKFSKKILRKFAEKTGITKELIRRQYVRFLSSGVKSDFMVLAMQRSGHHAIINWMRAMHESSVLFNNCNRKGIPYNIDGNPKATVVYRNFENFQPVFFEKNSIEYSRSILVLRNPWNQFCSYRKSSIRNKSENKKNLSPSFLEKSDIPILTSLWKSHALEALGKTDYLKDKTVILYDKWFDDEDYRRKIAKSMNLTFTDVGKHKISTYGGGSSFKNGDTDLKTELMKVKSRWSECDHDELYRSLFDDVDLIRLAEDLNFNKKF